MAIRVKSFEICDVEAVAKSKCVVLEEEILILTGRMVLIMTQLNLTSGVKTAYKSNSKLIEKKGKPQQISIYSVS